MAAKTPEPEKAAPASEGGGGGGGIKAWLPLIANVLLMPVLAYLMATKFLAPKTAAAPEPAKAEEKASEHGEKPAKAEKSSEHGEKAAEHGEKKEAESGKSEKSHGSAEKGHGGSEKVSASLSKLLVNVSGTLGTRYIQASLTLVSRNQELKGLVEKNDAQLRDAASSALSSKTITDLEKPGARNLIRAELISVCNNVLGSGVVSEIYLTEFAIQ